MSKVQEIYNSLLSDADFEPSLLGKVREEAAWKVAVQKLRQESNNEKALTYGVEDEHQKHPIDEKPNLEVAFDDITIKEFNEWFEKVRWKHKHDSWLEHPIRVKDHQKWFSEIKDVLSRERQYKSLVEYQETESSNKNIVEKFIHEKMPGASLEDFETIYDPGLGPEYFSKIILTFKGYDQLAAETTYFRNSKKIGSNHRRFVIRNKKIHVYHDSFVFDLSVQKQGFGTMINSHAEKIYKKIGVRSISLSANGPVGGYAWARQGFDFRNKRDRLNRIGFAKWLLDKKKYSNISSLMNELNSFTHSWEFAAWNPDNQPWGEHLGKEIMIESWWDGVKDLSDDSESYKIGQVYFRAVEKTREKKK